MLDAFFIVLVHPPPKRGLGDDLADVLENEIISIQIFVHAESIAFLVCLDDGHVGVLLVLEALILAVSSAPAITGALHFCGTVDAVRILSTGIVDCRCGIYAEN